MKAEKFLYENYGRPDLIGFKYISYILNNYERIDELGIVYEKLANKFDTNCANIERCIRFYSKAFGDKTAKEFINGLLIEYNQVR